MLRWGFKLILVLTSFAPFLVIVGIDFLNKNTQISYYLFAFSIILCAMCWGIIQFGSKKTEVFKVHIKEFNRRDQGIYTFLVIYLLPIIRSPSSLLYAALGGDCIAIISIIFIFSLIIISMVDIGAYNFNPIMLAFKYRFYEIKDGRNVPHLLIARKPLLRPGNEVQTWQISHNILVQIDF